MKHTNELGNNEIAIEAAKEILADSYSTPELKAKAQALINKQNSVSETYQPTKTKRSFSFHFPSKKAFAVGLIAIFLCSMFAFVAGTNMAYNVGYNTGAKEGYSSALVDTANLLQQKGITLDWKQQADGTYQLTARTPDGQTSQLTLAANFIDVIRNNQGQLKETARGAGTFTNLGKNWTLQQISKLTNVLGTESAPNATQYAAYLGESASSTGLSVTSLVLPSEITDHGLQRVVGTTSTYISAGSWNVTVVKTVITGSISPLVWGLYFTPTTDGYANTNTLLAYDTTPGTKALALGDTETETWTITLT